MRIEDILFLDLEITPRDPHKLVQAGVVMGEQAASTGNLSHAERMARAARALAGHNLLAHDRAWLEGQPIAAPLLTLPPVDTLLLSVLLRPDEKKHRLHKDYKRIIDGRNDPVEDARLCRDLLIDLGLIFQGLPELEQRVMAGLLQDQEGFAPFFEIFPPKAPPFYKDVLVNGILNLLGDRACKNADLQLLINKGGSRELAFAISIILGETPQIFTPSWLRFAFPMVERAFRRLRLRPCGDPGCGYCAERLDVHKGLFRHFGYRDFRRFEGDGEMPLQEQAVRAALGGESLVVIFPTGGGKSLTFQLPALLRAEADNALTVVVSPLQSLMKDQVDNLRQRQVTNAVAINGLLNPLERQEAFEALEDGRANLLYLSPESLRSQSIFQLLRGRTIARFVIDEAHCFSAWGHDFRVDYLYIGEFIKELKAKTFRPDDIPVSCFTATAKLEVVEDIQAYFQEKLGLKMQLFMTGQARKNLSFMANTTQDREEKFRRLMEALDVTEGPVIVYVSRVKTSERLAEALRGRGYSAAAYNGKMESAVKIDIQDRFKENELRIIVATTAFGMGVDKDNVALVVHYEISSSLENYQQEAGRAGRNDAMKARCLVLFDEEDLGAHFELLQGTKLNKKEIEQVWKGIKIYRRDRITKSAFEIAKASHWDEETRDLETRVKSAINALESVGYLERGFNSPVIFADSLRPVNFEAARAILYRNAGNFTDGQLQSAERVMQYLYGKDEAAVDYMATALQIELREMGTLLEQLKSIGILAQDRDMAARMAGRRSKDAPQQRLRKMLALEEWMWKRLFPDAETRKVRVHLRQMNSELAEDVGLGGEEYMADIRTLMRYWKFHRLILSERENEGEDIFAFTLRIEAAEFSTRYASRKQVASEVLRQLEEIGPGAGSGEVEFSVGELHKRILIANMFLSETSILDVEEALLYLHDAEVIELLRGLLVFYNRLTVKRLESNDRKQYTKEDYRKLAEYYEKKVEQIHIVGEYGRRLLEDQDAAAAFVLDYFALRYDEFLRKYFPGSRRDMIRRAMTEAKFEEIFGSLNDAQYAVVEDSAQRILVAAGPGSGKTRVLVHKMASLLLLEDVKAEQLLVLTFSRVAAQEFRNRLRELVPGMGKRVDIFTYHGYAFRLLGRIGDVRLTDNVLETATAAILNEEVPLDRVGGKTVIMLDEFQDVSKKEWEFLQAVISKAGDEGASDRTGDPRIIAAGDDDQCIYEFRGASLEYMRQLIDDGAKAHYFVKNYRAARNLVAFSNAFLAYLPQDRLKGGHVLESVQDEPGDLRLVRYQQGFVLDSLVDAVAARAHPGTVAVLTSRNEESANVYAALRQRKIPATLVQALQEFRIGQLDEFDWFTKELRHAVSGTEEGWFSNALVAKLLEQLRTQFSRSDNRLLVEQAIGKFMEEGKRRHLMDWLEYRYQLRTEDVLQPDQGRVYVTTIHKSKGKEFDAVYLLLDNYRIAGPAEARAIYVAITRAKRFLEIHTNRGEFDPMQVDGLERIAGIGSAAPMQEAVIECGLEDVWLDGFKPIASILSAQQVQAGDILLPSTQYANQLTDGNGNVILQLSKKMVNKLADWSKKGFKPKGYRVGHVVHWYDLKEQREYRVVLPRVEMG